MGCRLWGRTELDTTEATWQQQQQTLIYIKQHREKWWILLSFLFSEKYNRKEGRKERWEEGKKGEGRKKEVKRKGIITIMILMTILTELKYLVPNLAYYKGSMIAILLINETIDIYEISPLSYRYLSLI